MRPFAIYLLFACLLTVAACKKEDRGTANVMFVNTSPDAPALDVVQDNDVIATVAYPANSGYVNLSLNNTRFVFNKQGTDTTFLSLSNPTWVKDGYYTVVLIDSFYELDKILITDNLTTPASGKSLVRFVQAAPSVPVMDFLQNDSLILENRAFVGTDYATGVSGFNEFNPGTYNFSLRYADSSSNLIVTPIDLQSGKVYTLIARGNPGADLGIEVITNQ
jgi:hypothetical protein